MRLFAYQFQDSQNLEAMLQTQGIAVARCYQDEWHERPALSTLLDDCHQSPPDFVLVPSAIDLADDYQSLQSQLQSFWGHQVGIIALKPTEEQGESAPILLVPPDWPHAAPKLGKLPPAQRFTSDDWIAIGAHLQRQQQRCEIRHSHAQNRLQGLPPPGKAPYGYRRGKTSYLIDRRAAPVVKGFYEHFLLYGSLRRAVRFIHKTYGKSISPATGKRWLSHPVYRGHLCYHQSDIISDTHPPLLSASEAAQVDRLLKRNQRFATRSASAPRSLSGLVHCAACKSGMTISEVKKSDRQYLYLRPQCCSHQPKCRGLNYNQVLERTIDAICTRLPTAIAAFEPPTRDPKQAVLDQIASHQQILDQIPTLLETGILDSKTAQLRTFILQTELSQFREQLASFPPVNLTETAQAIAIPEFWQDLSETERRFYLREFVQSIQITRQGQNWDLNLQFVFERNHPT